MSLNSMKFAKIVELIPLNNIFNPNSIIFKLIEMHHSIKTQRKNDKLLNDGKLYVYHFLSESGEVKYWRCEYFNTVGVKCKGRLHTDVNDNILKTVGEHICNISPARIEAQRIVTGIKRRAVDTMEGPSTIRAQVLQNVPTPVLSAIPNKYATKKAMVGALRAKHPQCKINFCLFHLVRNMKKRISEQGLMQLYTNDVAFSLSARMITSLAFIPLQDLTPALAALENYLPDQLQPVLDWFIDNYVGQLRNNGTRRQPLFAPEEWSVHLRTLEGADRTNNFCEAFHRRLQRSFACTNPSIWHFIDTIRKEQKIVDADYAQFIAGHTPAPKKLKYRDADARILRLVQLYVPFNNGNGNGDHQYAMQNQNPQRIIDFLTGISKNYHMKN